MGKRRIGIFAFYEKDGIVEDYVIYLLRDLRRCLEKLVIVCNGQLSDVGQKKLKEFTSNILVRKNQGYDVGAFREALLSYVGRTEIQNYDEIVLCNDTFLGPFVPFVNIFDEMEKRQVNFWGLAAQPKTIDFWSDSNDIVPAFIQSFFIVVGKQMLQDERFWNYWEEMKIDGYNVTQVVMRHEQRFTPYFEALGYSWDVYTDNSFFEDVPEKNGFTPYLVIPYELIKYGKCPFLKKKCIVGKDISQGMEPENGSFAKAIEYIRDNTGYDYKLILYYMLSHCTKNVIADKLKLSYVVPEIKQDNEYKHSEVAIIVALKNMYLREKFEERLQELDKDIFTCIIENEDALNVNLIDEMVPKSTQYICVLQEKNGRLEKEVACTAISVYRYIYENLVVDTQYIASVVNFFEQDHFLGALVMPDMRFGILLNNTTDENEQRSYWIRKKALKNMSNYYIGTLYQQRYAELELINKKMILKSIMQLADIDSKITDFTSYFENKVFEYCRKQKKLYLYGAGGVGIRTAKALKAKEIHFDGFIVSDGQRKDNNILGYRVYFISEISKMKRDDIGVVIAVEERLHTVIEETLKRYDIKNYFYSFV